MDWNWFFTSVSQSAAALVGIFGAFIITKILTNQTAFTTGTVKIQELIAEGKRLTDVSRRVRFTWYHNHILKNFQEDLNDLIEKDSRLSVEEFFSKLSYSPYLPKTYAINKIAETLAEREARIAEQRRKVEEQRRKSEVGGVENTFKAYAGTSLVENLNVDRALFRHLNSGLEEMMREERKRMDDLYVEATHFTRVVANLHANLSINPESSPEITKSLRLVLLLFFIGVIYPLSFLPTPTDWMPSKSWDGLLDFICSVQYAPYFLWSLKGALLLFITGIFTYMVLMFLNMNEQMKYSLKSLQELEKYKSLKTYSSFLADREANEKARAEERMAANEQIKPSLEATPPNSQS